MRLPGHNVDKVPYLSSQSGHNVDIVPTDCHPAGSRNVVFLHGLAGHSGEWDRTVAALGSEFTTVAFDQRGHGASCREPVDTSREAFVADVVAVLDELGCRAPVTLVGQSMGAHTAFLTAAWHPDRLERLVMVEGDVGGGGDAAAAELRIALDSLPSRFDSYEQARDFFGGDTEAGHAWAGNYEPGGDGWRPRFDRRVMEAVMAPVFATERWDEWHSLRVPTTLVLGEHGDVDAARVERMCAARPETGRVVIPGAGHDVHLDQSEAWIDTLQHTLEPASPTELDN